MFTKTSHCRNGGPGSFLVDENEKRELMEVIESGHLSRYGDPDDPKFLGKVLQFEAEFARQLDVAHVIAMNAGTSALVASLLTLGIGESDEVIVPTYTYVATYMAVIFVGAVPVLCDIDESLCLDPEEIENHITDRTRAVIPVHMLGRPCDMDGVMRVAARHRLAVVEDVAQAGGGRYRGRALGAIGDIGAYSLNVTKTITAGDGGAIATQRRDLYEHAFAIHDQGHKPLRSGVAIGSRPPLGLNFKVSELFGAVALAQARKLPHILQMLREKKRLLQNALGPNPAFRFATTHDEVGECGTIVTTLFHDKTDATRVSRSLGTMRVAESGWHVYSNMEHLSEFLRRRGRPCGLGAFPKSDAILERAVNLSVGVVDRGLGAGFGVNIKSTDDEIVEVARRFLAEVSS